MNKLSEALIQSQFTQLNIYVLLINIFIGFVLAVILRYFYNKFGTSISNKDQFSKIFPLLTVTIVLIISIVKSSLALSLGLVGALSIVRFRTPIKDPEELVYLFLSIGVGLGLGANQTVPTVVVFIFIILFMFINSLRQHEKNNKNLFLNIILKNNLDTKNKILENISQMLIEFDKNYDLRRFDFSEQNVDINFVITINNISDLQKIFNKINEVYPKAEVSAIDQNGIPSI